MRLGNDLVGDHEQHSATGEGEPERQDPFAERDRARADQAADRFDEAGKESDEHGMEPGIADRQEGDRHGEPFRQVLQADTDGERGAVAEIAAAEADPDGEPLRAVVERSEAHTSEPKSRMRLPYAVFVLKKTISGIGKT